MGDCACGESDTLPVAVHNDPELVDEPDKKEKEILQARKEEARYFGAGDRQRKSFLKGSLFEKDFGDEEGIITEKKTSYNIDWDRHLEEVSSILYWLVRFDKFFRICCVIWDCQNKSISVSGSAECAGSVYEVPEVFTIFFSKKFQVTEDTLLDRTPAVALDMLYTIDLPDDIDSEKLSAISDLENSDLGERAICRVVFGPTQIHFCTGAYHRLQCMFYHLAKYDYPPYRDSLETPPEKGLPVDNAEKLLDNNTKVRVYQLTAINPSFFIYAADHPLLATKDCLLRRKAQLGKTNKAKVIY